MISIVLVLVSLVGLAWAQNILMYAILQFTLGAADGGNTSYIIGIVHFVIVIQFNTGYRNSVSACGFAYPCMRFVYRHSLFDAGDTILYNLN